MRLASCFLVVSRGFVLSGNTKSFTNKKRYTVTSSQAMICRVSIRMALLRLVAPLDGSHLGFRVCSSHHVRREHRVVIVLASFYRHMFPTTSPPLHPIGGVSLEGNSETARKSEWRRNLKLGRCEGGIVLAVMPYEYPCTSGTGGILEWLRREDGGAETESGGV